MPRGKSVKKVVVETAPVDPVVETPVIDMVIEDVLDFKSDLVFEGKKIVEIIGNKTVGKNHFMIGRGEDGATYDIPTDK